MRFIILFVLFSAFNPSWAQVTSGNDLFREVDSKHDSFTYYDQASKRFVMISGMTSGIGTSLQAANNNFRLLILSDEYVVLKMWRSPSSSAISSLSATGPYAINSISFYPGDTNNDGLVILHTSGGEIVCNINKLTAELVTTRTIYFFNSVRYEPIQIPIKEPKQVNVNSPQP